MASKYGYDSLADMDARLSKPPRARPGAYLLTMLCSRCQERRPVAAFKGSLSDMANLDTVCIPCRVVEEALQSGSVALRAMLRKDCIACARSLPLTEFWHRRSGGRPGKDGGKGGRQKVCKQCTAEGKGGYTLKTTTK